jgi:hypothetical protein
MFPSHHPIKLVILAIIIVLCYNNPTDFILGEEYEGQYSASQSGVTPHKYSLLLIIYKPTTVDS